MLQFLSHIHHSAAQKTKVEVKPTVPTNEFVWYGRTGSTSTISRLFKVDWFFPAERRESPKKQGIKCKDRVLEHFIGDQKDVSRPAGK